MWMQCNVLFRSMQLMNLLILQTVTLLSLRVCVSVCVCLTSVNAADFQQG